MGFWDTAGEVGNVLGNAATAFGQGIAPFTAWEGVRTASTQSDARDIQNRNAALLQAQNEANPDHYRAQEQQAYTGFGKETAANQAAQFTSQQALALQQYVTSPGFQQRWNATQPGSVERAQLLDEAKGITDPFGSQTYYGTDVMPAQNRAEQMQIAADYVKRAAGIQKDPQTGMPYGAENINVQFDQNSGQWVVTTADGRPVDIGQLGLTVGAQIRGDTAPMAALLQRTGEARTTTASNFKNQNDTINAIAARSTNPLLTTEAANVRTASTLVTNALTNLSKAQNAMYVGGETEKAAAVAPLQAAYDRAYTDWQMSVQKFRETADSTNVQTGVRIGGAGVPQAAGAQVGGVPMGYQIGADGVPVAGVAGAAPGQPNYYNAPPMAPRPGVPYAVQNMAAHGYVTPRPLGPGRMSFAPQGTVQRNTASLAEGARLNAESGATTAGGNQGWLIAGAPGVYGPVLPPDVYGRGR